MVLAGTPPDAWAERLDATMMFSPMPESSSDCCSTALSWVPCGVKPLSAGRPKCETSGAGVGVPSGSDSVDSGDPVAA